MTLLDELNRRLGRSFSKDDCDRLWVDELGLDSLDVLEIILTLEDLGVVFPSGLIGNMRCLADVPNQGDNLASSLPSSDLESWHVRLRGIRREDESWLYTVATHPANLALWRFRGAPPSEADFSRTLGDGVYVQFVAEERDSGEPFGHAIAYNPTMNRDVSVAIVCDPAVHGSGLGIEAIALFADYLFRALEAERVFLEMLDMGSAFAGRRALSARTTHVATLKEHDYLWGEYRDMLVFSVDRATWEDRCGDLVPSLRGQQTCPSHRP